MNIFFVLIPILIMVLFVAVRLRMQFVAFVLSWILGIIWAFISNQFYTSETGFFERNPNHLVLYTIALPTTLSMVIGEMLPQGLMAFVDHEMILFLFFTWVLPAIFTSIFIWLLVKIIGKYIRKRSL